MGEALICHSSGEAINVRGLRGIVLQVAPACCLRQWRRDASPACPELAEGTAAGTAALRLLCCFSTSSRTWRTRLRASTAPARARWRRGNFRRPLMAFRRLPYLPRKAELCEILISYLPTGFDRAESCAPDFAAPCVSDQRTTSDSSQRRVNIHVSCRTARRLRRHSPALRGRHTSYKSAADGRRRSRRGSCRWKSKQFRPARCAPPFRAASR